MLLSNRTPFMCILYYIYTPRGLERKKYFNSWRKKYFGRFPLYYTVNHFRYTVIPCLVLNITRRDTKNQGFTDSYDRKWVDIHYTIINHANILCCVRMWVRKLKTKCMHFCFFFFAQIFRGRTFINDINIYVILKRR